MPSSSGALRKFSSLTLLKTMPRISYLARRSLLTQSSFVYVAVKTILSLNSPPSDNLPSCETCFVSLSSEQRLEAIHSKFSREGVDERRGSVN